MKRQISAILASAVLLGSVRCATVADGSYETVRVTSNPPGAAIGVDCGRSERRPNAKTPATVRLQRSADPCRIVVTKAGYEHAVVQLRREFSRRALSNYNAALGGLEAMDAVCCEDEWAILGVFTVGSALFGTVGLAVDRASGAMYRHEPQFVHLQLAPLEDFEEEATDGE